MSHGGLPFTYEEALSAWPGPITLLTVADGRDDLGMTVSASCPVSVDPPLILVSLMAQSYLAEVLGSAAAPAMGKATGTPGPMFAVTLLAADQRMLAGWFAAAGRPHARVLLDGVPHRRGEKSGALIPADGLAAFEANVATTVPAGDHLLVIGEVVAVPYVAASGQPLIRFRGGYQR
jgi:flavin reductase (DIM6/NTAB) family NADH-FMN oxidoreductase RutF